MLDACAAKGFAIADQLMEIGVVSIAVPVRDLSARVVAGINVIAQTARGPAGDRGELPAAARRAADALVALLHERRSTRSP